MKKTISIFIVFSLLVSSFLASESVAALGNDTNSDDFYNKTVISSDDIDFDIIYSDEYKQYLIDLENGDTEKYGDVIPSKLPPVDADTYVDEIAPVAITLPSKYDPRETGMTTSVKNQGGRGLCWAFSALAGAEQTLLKDTGKEYDLSENYYNYLMAMDALGSNKTNPFADGERNLDKGGWSENVFSSIMIQRGPLLESEFPYSITGSLDSTDIFTSTPVVYSYGYDDFPSLSGDLTTSVMNTRIKKIKEAIYENGSCNIYQDFTNLYSQYYNPTNHSLYIPTTESTGLTHALCIVGWNDSYSKYNFNVTPNNDGAFIVKNSWGSDDYGESGYYYLSYEDYFIYREKMSSIKDMTDQAKYDKIDYHTEYSPVLAGMSYQGSFFIANVYDAEEYAKQELAAVGIQTLYDGAEFEIYVNPYNATLSNSSLTKVYSGVAKNAGYNTFKLDKPVSIESSDGKYAVAIKFLSDGSNSSTSISMACETKTENGIYKPVNNGESFFSVSGDLWNDCSSGGMNFYINAYTNYVNEIENDTLSVRFYKPESWKSSVYIHVFNTANQNTTWPGTRMTMVKNGIYQYDNSSLENCKIIINDGTNQTSEFTVSGRVTIKDDKVIKRSSKPIEVQFKKPSNWGDDIKIYYYSNDGNEVERSAWPGESMTNIGQGYYTYTITDMASARIIFTDGAYQTPGANVQGILANAGQKLIYENNSYRYEDVETLNVLFKKPSGWGNNIYIHLWNARGYETEWPGTKMTLLANGYYQYKNSNLYSCNAVITDGTRKTGNLDLVGQKTYINGKIINNSSKRIKLTFVKPSNWSDDIRVYYYTNDSNEVSSMEWPGYSMMNNGNGVYTYTITDMAYIRVIFTDGTNQTPFANTQGYPVIAGQHLIYNNGNIIYENY